MAIQIRDIVFKKGTGKYATYELKKKGEELIVGIIQGSEQTDKLVEFAEHIGISLLDLYQDRWGQDRTGRDSISTSQIRNIFGEVRQIEMEWKHNPEASWVRLQLLRPKLAYTAKKADKNRAIIFRDVLSTAILNVEGKPENFQRFISLFEAILAYHRAYGGR